MVDMHQLGESLVGDPFRSSLLALRELFQVKNDDDDDDGNDESRASGSNNDGVSSKYVRIGNVPLDLDTLGDAPEPGEISG